MVSAWACEQKFVLGQRKVADKSNEITAIPELPYHPSIYPDLPKPWDFGITCEAGSNGAQACFEERAHGSSGFPNLLIFSALRDVAFFAGSG